jgi:hypothetical protein
MCACIQGKLREQVYLDSTISTCRDYLGAKMERQPRKQFWFQKARTLVREISWPIRLLLGQADC